MKKPFNEILADELDRQAKLIVNELNINFFRPHKEFMELADAIINLRNNANKLRNVTGETKHAR